MEIQKIVTRTDISVSDSPSDSPTDSPTVSPKAARDPLAEATLKLSYLSFGRDKISLGELLEAVGAQGPSLAAALLTLPFLQPIPLFGLSTPAGLTIAVSGVGLLLGKKVLLPKRLAAVNLPADSVLKAAEFLARFEVMLKPYLKSESNVNLSDSITRFLGLMIAIHGVLLALPLPIPFSNAAPAWLCLFASLAVLFASRRLFWVSVAAVFVNIAYWTALTMATVWGSTALVEWLGISI